MYFFILTVLSLTALASCQPQGAKDPASPNLTDLLGPDHHHQQPPQRPNDENVPLANEPIQTPSSPFTTPATRTTDLQKEQLEVLSGVATLYQLIERGIADLKNGKHVEDSDKLVKQAKKLRKEISKIMKKSIKRLEKAADKHD